MKPHVTKAGPKALGRVTVPAPKAAIKTAPKSAIQTVSPGAIEAVARGASTTDPNSPVQPYDPVTPYTPAEPAATDAYDGSSNNFQARPREPEEQQEQEQQEQAAPADEPEAATLGTSVSMMQVLKVPVVDRWRRWVEWGSPFATTPGHLVNVSGEEEATVSRVRFVATLHSTLVPQNLPDMSWMFIRRLSIDPFADLNFQLIPFSLKRDSFYEFRFFSRLKSNPTKADVKKAMASMGFSPMKLNMLKKNMRIPHRMRVSVSMWLGIGKWSAPNSVVTSEDPFFFEALKEVKP